eukprot:1362842-Prymnesium_polylepis.1
MAGQEATPAVQIPKLDMSAFQAEAGPRRWAQKAAQKEAAERTLVRVMAEETRAADEASGNSTEVNNDDPFAILSQLDEERLIIALSREDIRLLCVAWLLAQPESYRLQRRQDLEELQEKLKREGAALLPFLSGQQV